MRFALLCLVAGLGALGCKKPEVEMVEGPPLAQPPEPVRGDADAPSAGPGGAVPRPAPPELTLAQACDLLTARLRYGGIRTGGRSCISLRVEGTSIRLDGLVFASPRSPGHTETYNACLWRRESDPSEWEVGFIDSMHQPCVDRDTYCRRGAHSLLAALSHTACPGDREHALPAPEHLLERLQGTWRHASGRALTIAPDGTVTDVGPDGVRTVSRLVLESADRGSLILQSGARAPIYYALLDGALHFSTGRIVPADNPDAFVIPVAESWYIRRYDGACWDIRDPPQKEPTRVPCTIAGQGASAVLTVPIMGRETRFERVGAYWMEPEARFLRFERPADEATRRRGPEETPLLRVRRALAVPT